MGWSADLLAHQMKFRSDTLAIDPATPFANDALEREPVVTFLELVIGRAEGSMVLALDSPWGTGKTTLVHMLKAKLESKGYRSIYFNAWEVDYASDPLIAMVSKIDLLSDGESPESKRRMTKLKSLAMLVGKRGLIAAAKAATLGALDWNKEIDAALAQGTGDASSDLFDLVVKEGECLKKFREELATYVELLQQGGPTQKLIFFIDELDRCRPTFAIELLERVKHLFDVPNIIFVLAIDRSQLEVSTAAVYGAGINAREYLRRFIHLDFQVPQLSGKAFTSHLLHRFGMVDVFAERQGQLRADLDTFVDVFCLLAEVTGMSLRTQEQCIARLALVMSQTPANHYLYPVLAATLIVTRTMNPELFSKIKSGAGSTEDLMEWLDVSRLEPRRAERLAIAVESEMNAADPRDTRRASRLERLRKVATSPESGHVTPAIATKVLRFSEELIGSLRAPKLAYLTAKIDLADRLGS